MATSEIPSTNGRKFLTYYDDVAGIDSEITKMVNEVQDYVTEIVSEVQEEVDKRQMAKAKGKSKKQKETKETKTKVSRKKNSSFDTQEEAYAENFHVIESKPYDEEYEARREKMIAKRMTSLVEALMEYISEESDHTELKAEMELDPKKDAISSEPGKVMETEGEHPTVPAASGLDETHNGGLSGASPQNEDRAKPEKTNPEKSAVEKVQLTKPLTDMAAVLRVHAAKKNLYAIKFINGGMRSAKFSLCEGKLLLHRLRRKFPPEGATIVQHSDVMKLVDPSSRVTFFEMSEDSCMRFGKLIINLFGDTKGARQFSYLCTGERGPCLGGTRAVRVFGEKHERLECVRFGDYEYDSGAGGKPLLSLSGEEGKEEYAKPWVAGTLEGGWLWKKEIGAQFDILMKDNPGKTCPAAFGKVKSGLDGLDKLLRASSRFPYMICIHDCGIVLQ